MESALTFAKRFISRRGRALLPCIWRIARDFDSTVLRQVSEADVAANVVVVFKATKPGAATVISALTRGETAKALESRTFKVSVR